MRFLREVKCSAFPEPQGFSHSSPTGAQADAPIGRSCSLSQHKDMDNDTTEHSEAARQKNSMAASTSTL